MIRICVKKDKAGTYRSFTCTGHAGYAEAGEDIVCAGVTALVGNTVNCLTDLLGEDVSCVCDEAGAKIGCTFQGAPGEKASFLIDCMLYGLTWIRRQYGAQYLTCETLEED